MTTIHKYPLQIVDEQIVRMPKFAEVDTENPMDSRRIEIIGTGNPIRREAYRRHIDTVQLGPLVWHIFERTAQL